MKKVFKLLLAIILAIVILGGVMFLVDCSKGKSGNAPIFATSDDVETGLVTTFNGLGYKIKYNMQTGQWDALLGSWSIVLQKGNYIIEPDLSGNEENNNVKNEISGDIVIDNNPSGEIIISGDNEKIESNSGDSSGDNEIINNVSGDEENTEIISGDVTVDENDDTEIPQENEFVFEAVIIGINNNNLVVQALQDEAINASADMFSFSLNEENNAEGTEFLIGQNVKIEYTGTIAESYPAQIHVVSIEIAK